MTCDFSVVEPEWSAYRTPDAWAWPDWNRAGPDGTFSNRWDDMLRAACKFNALRRIRGDTRPVSAGHRRVAAIDEIDEIDGIGETSGDSPLANSNRR